MNIKPYTNQQTEIPETEYRPEKDTDPNYNYYF